MAGIRTHNVGDDMQLIVHVVVNPTTIQSRPRQSLTTLSAIFIYFFMSHDLIIFFLNTMLSDQLKTGNPWEKGHTRYP